MEGQRLIVILVLMAWCTHVHSKSWKGKCFEGTIHPIDQEKKWIGDSCYDLEGNQFWQDQTLLSCCGCIKIICNTSQVAGGIQSSWTVAEQDTCCKDYEGKVYPIGTLMKTETMNDNCSTTVTKQCVVQNEGNKTVAVISDKFKSTTCCCDHTGQHPIGKIILVPETSSSRKCSKPPGHIIPTWISTIKRRPDGSHCGNGCVHEGELVCDGDHVTFAGGAVATCCKGQLLIPAPEGIESSSTKSPSPTESSSPTSSTPEPGRAELTKDASWKEWSSWSSCSGTCGIAVRTRKRICLNPPCPPGSEEETVSCRLPTCGPFDGKCFRKDSKITFLDLGHNHLSRDLKPLWTLSDSGRRINEKETTRPSIGLSNLGNFTAPVSFSGQAFSTANEDYVIGMAFGFFNETNFFVVASSAQIPGPTNWYVGRLHATCGSSCATTTTISDAIWAPLSHPKDITVLATGSTYWRDNNKYNFDIYFDPSELRLSVNVTVEGEEDPVLESGVIEARTYDVGVDEISRKGGFLGVYMDSQAKTTWDKLSCN